MHSFESVFISFSILIHFVFFREVFNFFALKTCVTNLFLKKIKLKTLQRLQWGCKNFFVCH